MWEAGCIDSQEGDDELIVHVSWEGLTIYGCMVELGGCLGSLGLTDWVVGRFAGWVHRLG